MTHLSKVIPYRNTGISYNQSKIHIEEMLKEAGAVGLRWTETKDTMEGKTMPLLEFLLTTKWEGIERQFGVRVQAPLLFDRKRVAYQGLVNTPNRNASMRLLYWYLKSRLEAVKFGLEDIFDAFMSRVINSLPDGQTITMAETIREHPEVISEILPSFEIKPRALPLKEIKENE